MNKRRKNPVVLCLLLLTVIWIGQSWVVTAGFAGWPFYTDDYRRLADGFLHGQLSLSTPPSPKLMALADPYDPAQNARYRLHDAAYFGGNYYLYWGPVPALLAAGVCWVLGIAHPTFGDQYLVMAFMFGASALATVLMFQARAKFRPEAPDWTVAAAALSLGQGGSVMFTLARPAVYEAAIGGGQFFLLAGIMAAWFGIQRRSAGLAGTAGVCWALAVGSRLSLGPAVAAMAALTAWSMLRQWKRLVALTVPLAIGAALLGWYNQARFGSATEFGLRYQLADQNQHAVKHPMLSLRYAAVNGAVYLLMPPAVSGKFPFVTAEGWQEPVRSWLGLPKSYQFEASVGLIWSEPVLLLAVLAGWKRWFTPSLAVGALVGFAPVLALPGSTMRYLVDLTPCLAVLAAMGIWKAWERTKTERGRRWLKLFVSAAVVWEIGLGFVLGLTGYYHHFAESNPAVFSAIKRLVWQ